MERREAVKYISILLGGAVVGGTSFLTGCKSETGKPMPWDEKEIAYLDEIAETILPQTATPGAKAARVGDFMKVYVNDCYEAGDQKVFREGMDKIHELSSAKYGKDFMNITPAQRTELLTGLDREAKAYQQKVKEFNDGENKKEQQAKAEGREYTKNRMSPHYFSLMKQLTLLGYFTSEVGMKQAMRYSPVPGKYEGCIPYKKGDKAFA